MAKVWHVGYWPVCYGRGFSLDDKNDDLSNANHGDFPLRKLLYSLPEAEGNRPIGCAFLLWEVCGKFPSRFPRTAWVMLDGHVFRIGYTVPGWYFDVIYFMSPGFPGFQLFQLLPWKGGLLQLIQVHSWWRYSWWWSLKPKSIPSPWCFFVAFRSIFGSKINVFICFQICFLTSNDQTIVDRIV